MKRVIGIAADHNGVETKEYLIKNLELDQNLAVRCIDLGPYNSVESVDYTDYSHQLSRLVSNQQLDLGILVCGTGVGMSIAANKVEGCRAALIHNTFSAPKSREHNDSNVLCLGAWVVDDEVNLEICKLWLQEDFGEGRHVRRIEKIEGSKSNDICFTYGCFDILTSAHIKLLEWCKTFNKKIIVGLNSDESVSRLKGENRPYLKYTERFHILNSLACVDQVIEVDKDYDKLIEQINPSVIVKGGNFTEDAIRKNDRIPPNYRIKIFPMIEESSKKEILSKIKNA